ncbi:hypothetical protein ACUN24_20545 [Pedobacter sp. WC2501]|uniref:hypothetical protein n=1 Tax=Pedobacter sp. WC2501 TaxID=3461400 RepID=UPI0040459F10
MTEINELIAAINAGDFHGKRFSPEQIFDAFKQGTVALPFPRRIGGGGNCASVALVKVAIASYGLDGVFRSIGVDYTNERYLVGLRDGQVNTLSFEDYRTGVEKSAFEAFAQGGDAGAILEFGRFCFAVMAEVKRTMYGWGRYQRAINDLNKSEGADEVHRLLGLPATQVADVSIAALSRMQHVLVWNRYHAVYSSGGYYDEFFHGVDGKALPSKMPLSELQHVHGDGQGDGPSGAHVFL